MRNAAVFIFIFLAIGLALYANSAGQRVRENDEKNVPAAVPETSEQAAVRLAQVKYGELKTKGTDFTSGPCISENLMPDWVADVTHDPRQPADDNPANQCRSFREGRARHFVELDPEGSFIRAY